MVLELGERGQQYFTALEREPVFIVRVDLDGTDANALYITSRPGVTGIPGTNVLDGALADLSDFSSEIFPEEARATIGGATFDVTDVGHALTDYLELLLESGISVQNKAVEFRLAFVGWGYADTVLYSTLRVTGITYTDGRYRFDLADLNRFLRRQVFDPKKTTLGASILETDTTIPVLSTADFQAVRHNALFSEDPAGDWVYVRIDDEVIACPESGIQPAAFTNVRRGAFGTRPHAVKITGTDFDRGKAVAEYIYLEGNAIDLAYALMHGEMISDPAVTLPAHWHAGIDRDDIKRANFVEIGEDIFDEADPADGLVLRLLNLKRTDAKQFIEREIFRPVGVFSPILRSGRIGLKRLTPVITEASPVLTIDADLVASYSPVRYVMADVRNIVSVDWNRHPVKDVFTRATQVIDSDSVTDIQDAKEIRVQFQGIASTRQTDQAVQGIIDKYRDRLGSPPIRFDVTCLHYAAILELGDIVRVRLPFVRDYTAGVQESGPQVELDRVFEVRRVAVDHQTARVSVSLGATSRTSRPLPIPELQPVIPDAWYGTRGIDLNTIIPITIDGQGGYITQPGSYNLPSASQDAKQNVYYFTDGDLTIGAGTTITFEKSIELVVRGFLQWDGVASAVGAGRPGTNAPAGAFPLQLPTGVAGYVGNTVASPGVESHRNPAVPGSSGIDSLPAPETVARYGAFPYLTALRWDEDDQKLKGYPGNLAGSSGGPGAAAAATVWGAEPGTNDYIRQSTLGYKWGTAGGDSGGGLVIVCRGMEFGSQGSIDVSGTDSLPPTKFTGNGRDLYPGAGGAGGPGAICILLDGGGSVQPDLAGHVVARYGVTEWRGNPMPSPTVGQNYEQATPGLTGYVDGARLQSDVEILNAATHVQYVPTNATAGVGDDDQGPATVPELVTSVRFNSSPASAPPPPPLGDGTNDGWSDTPRLGGQWMATKTNVDETAGAWSPSIYVTAVPTGDLGTPEVNQVLAWDGADYLNAYRMNWAGVWIGGTYQPSDVVTDGGFLAVANKVTEEKPAPVPAGPEQWLTGFGDAPPWTDDTLAARYITTGVRVRSSLAWTITGARIWVPEVDGTTQYEVWLVTDPLGTPAARLLRPRFVPGAIGWEDIATGTQIVPEGVDLDLILIKYAAGGFNAFQGDWSVSTSNQAPATGGATFRNNGTGCDVHHTADGGQDRQTQLESVPIGAQLIVEGQSWTVTSVTPKASSVEYGITPNQGSPPAGVRTLRFEWGDAEPIELVRVDNHWTGSPDITGLFGETYWTEGGADVVENQNAYGVDFYGYLTSQSDDWDLLAATGADLAGGGGGGSAFDPTQSYNITGTWSFANPVTGVDPTAAAEFATKNYVDSVATFDPADDQTITGDWQFNGQIVVVTPTLAAEAANKGYADAVAAVAQGNAESYADTGDAATLASAQAYADQVEVDANAYADSRDALTLASANAYTDAELAAADLADVTRANVPELITKQWTFDPDSTVAGVLVNNSYLAAQRADNVSDRRLALRATDAGGTGLDIFVSAVSSAGYQLRPRWDGVAQDASAITYQAATLQYNAGGAWEFSNPVTAPTPTAAGHLATKGYVDNVAGFDPALDRTITGDWQFSGQCIVQTPALGAEAANKGYADAVAAVAEGNANSYTDSQLAGLDLADVTRRNVPETITEKWTFDPPSGLTGFEVSDSWATVTRSDVNSQDRLGYRLQDDQGNALDIVLEQNGAGWRLRPRVNNSIFDAASLSYDFLQATYRFGALTRCQGGSQGEPANFTYETEQGVQKWPSALNKNVLLNQASVSISSANGDAVVISNSGTPTVVTLPAAGADLDSIGMAFEVLNSNLGDTVTINAPAGGVLVWHTGSTTQTGDRSLAYGGWARLVRRAANQWHIWGEGIS